jgi:hypothetical protein
LGRPCCVSEQPEKDKLLNLAVDYATRAVTLMPGKGEPIYNKACYQIFLGGDQMNKTQILAELKTAFQLNPALRKIASDDPDLDAIRQDTEFVKLMDAGQTPNA